MPVSNIGVGSIAWIALNWEAFGIPIGIYGIVAITYILFKAFIARFYEPVDHSYDYDGESVSVVIPEYNEDADLFERGLKTVLNQDYDNLEEIWVIDDGSDHLGAWEVAKQYAEEYEIVNVARLDENQGKRHAQAKGFKQATGDVFVTIDSDTLVKPGAIRELVQPFHDPEVQAVTGQARIVDPDEKLLRKLIDMRFWVAFNVERACRSVFGTVIVCSGVFSAYRRELVVNNLDDYVNQEFLGAECTFGDDRHMTSYALRRGKVVYQSTAKVLTDTPDELRDYLTQQTRWMRSFWRESMLALRWAPSRSKLLAGMIAMDMVLPFALVFFGFGAVIFRSLTTAASIPLIYVGIIFAIAYIRNVPYSREDFTTYLLAPVYGILYLVTLLPLTFYALATINSTSWGTR
ncbi:glycosyltransferase [Natrialba taiwanensis]|uniref:Hyaluronan synthase n=1 Tax=Natrialba taiwanensis DSM 12281 TaxID=1230458 RepID=L9ZL15_9EURY|nr:glycosyltransferase [Natrialba taiwanensis]ELY86252.1 hyaluronan synthase [Natrialba taiwanensis DSM 12281]